MTSLSPADAERLRQAFLRCRDMEGTLGAQLRAYAEAGREVFPAYGEAVDRLVARINENGGGENAPRPGEAMPPFLLPDETGRLVSLASLLAQGPVAVMFYRGHWCPYCRLNVWAVVQALDRIGAAGGHVVAIMPETQTFAEKFKAEGAVPFPILTDLDNGYALSLNLAIWLEQRFNSCWHTRTWRAFTVTTAGSCLFLQRSRSVATGLSKPALSIRTSASAWRLTISLPH
jgi:peroxiredoxin